MLYAKNSVSHCECYKVHCTCAVSRDLCIGSPPKPHVTIFLPRTVYSLYNFYGATMMIKGSLYWSIAMLKRFSAAKKLNSSQNRFKKWRILGNLRVYILIVVIGTPKRHILGRNDVFWRIFRKNPFRGVGCSELQELQKSVKNVTPDGTENHVYGEHKPWRERDKIWHAELRSRLCPHANFCQDRLRG